MQPLYLQDSYLKEFDAEVKEVKEKFLVLDNTAFYPQGGGQLFDEGIMKTESGEYRVVFVGKFSGQIRHEVDKPGLKVGDKVHCTIDWEKRYTLMRMHTAAHILSEIINKDSGALITGNQLGTEKSRIDFSLENYDPEKVKTYIDEANQVISRNLDVTAENMSREEAEKLPQASKLAKGLPESLKELRIVSIGDFDVQADAGTHVKSTSEVGKLELIKYENKGKNFRRLYFKLV